MHDLDATLSRLANLSMLALPEDAADLKEELAELLDHLEDLAALDTADTAPFCHAPHQTPHDASLRAVNMLAPDEIAALAPDPVWQEGQVFISVPSVRDTPEVTQQEAKLHTRAHTHGPEQREPLMTHDQQALPESIAVLHHDWAHGALSMVSLYRALDARLHRDEGLNIWLARTPLSRLLEQAAALDAIPLDARGDALTTHPLLGVPVGVKDNICTRTLPTTAASGLLRDYVSPCEATVITRLERAGAIILGKTNMDEFGMGSTGTFSAFGPTKNPIDPAHVPGGSSSGSAAALAASHCMVALGSDTGGSVRQPASHCGVWALAPTYGSVSRYGLIAHASNLEQIGPMARTLEDLGTLYRTIAAHDPRDATSSLPHHEPISWHPGERLRLGIFDHWRAPEVCSAEVWQVLEQRIMCRDDVEIIPFESPWIAHASAVYAVLSAAQASSNLARYDGVRFGARHAPHGSLSEMMRASRTKGFGPEVKRRILLGAYVLSADAFESHVMQAQRVRALIARALEEALSRCDVLLLPAAPFTAPQLHQPCGTMTDRFLDDALTVLANLAGLPALCLPCGELHGLPVGAQLIGPRRSDLALIDLAQHLTGEGGAR